MHDYAIGIVATNALLVKHRAISILSYLLHWPRFIEKNMIFTANNLRN